jgi:putative transposase
VFVTLGRQPVIDRQIAAFLQSFFDAKCAEMDVHLLAQGILCDHVHLLISLRPSHYIPEVVNLLKGTSSHEANHHHQFNDALYWMRGYRVSTIGADSLKQASAYVRAQHRHHPDKIPT